MPFLENLIYSRQKPASVPRIRARRMNSLIHKNSHKLQAFAYCNTDLSIFIFPRIEFAYNYDTVLFSQAFKKRIDFDIFSLSFLRNH